MADERTAMVRRLFARWQLSPGEKADLLGMRPMGADDVGGLLEGDAAYAGRDVEARVGHLLEIHALLRQLFPQNRELAYAWMSAPNRAFNDQTPLDVVREQGVDGLILVRAYLSGR